MEIKLASDWRWKYVRKVEVYFPFCYWISLIILSLWFTFPIWKMGSLLRLLDEMFIINQWCPLAHPLPPVQILCMARASRAWLEPARHAGLGGGIPTVAPCQEWALVSDGACGCSGEMAALSRMLLWLEDFILIPHCPLSVPKRLGRETHVAKSGSGVLTSYM